jgi:hypothetical protein
MGNEAHSLSMEVGRLTGVHFLRRRGYASVPRTTNNSREGPQFSTKKNPLFDFSSEVGVLKPNARPPRNSRSFLFLSPMARMSFVALFALALSGVASAAPALSDLHARASQTFTPCVPIPGTCVFACQFPTCRTQCCRHAGLYPVQIDTVVTSSSPVSGQYLNVLVSGYTQNEIVVSRPSQCSKWRWLITEFRPIRSPRSPWLKTTLIRCGAQPSTFAARKSTVSSL